MFGRTRCKSWTPLATQQLRLRHLVRIIGYNVRLDPSVGKGLYYTLHLATMCAPFYTSEKVQSDQPKWKELELGDEFGHNSGVVIRIWVNSSEETDRIVCVWGVYFSGLVYLGNKLQEIALPQYFENNTIIFEFIGGYFTSHKSIKKSTIYDNNQLITSNYCVEGGSGSNPTSTVAKIPFVQNINLINNQSEEKVFRNSDLGVSKQDVRKSYTVKKLQELHMLQLSIRNVTAENKILRKRICEKCPMFDDNPTDLCDKPPTAKNTVSSLGFSSLNKFLNEQSQPTRYQRQQTWKLKKEIEVAKFNCKLLSQEKDRKSVYLRQLNQTYVKLNDENDYASSLLMDRYRQLSRDLEKMRDWRKSWADTREAYLHSSVYLNLRRKQLMSELLDIYPIQPITGTGRYKDGYTVCGVYLPQSESLADNDDASLSVGLGYVTHILQMCSIFLNIPLRYPIQHSGSRSKIYNYITDKIPDKDREFPLYVRGKDQRYFQYAVYLLNQNIAQLRTYCGLPTQDLRLTLPNLLTLLQFRHDDRHDVIRSNNKRLENLHIATHCDNNIVMKNGGGNMGRDNSLLRSHCVDCNIEQGLDLLDPRASLLLCNSLNEHSMDMVGVKVGGKRCTTRSMGDYDDDVDDRIGVSNSPSSEPVLRKELPSERLEEQRTEFLQEWLNSGPALVCSEEHLYPEEFLGTTLSRGTCESDQDSVSRDSGDRD